MDFGSLNKASTSGNYPTTVPLSALPKDETFKIVNLRKINTKYGEKFVAGISGHRCFFMPKDVTDYLLKYVREFNALQGEVKMGEISCKPLGGSSFEFVMNRAKKSKCLFFCKKKRTMVFVV